MRFRLLPLMAVVAVLVAACGGSSTPTTTTKKQSSHKASSSQAKTSTSATANTTAATNTSASGSSTSSSKPTFASISNCTNLSGVGEQFAKAMSSSTSGGKFDLSAMVKAYQNLANEAPGAIRSDVQAIAGAFSAYASALSKAHYTFGTVPNASQITELEQATKVFSQAKLKNASKAIEAWAVANCS